MHSGPDSSGHGDITDNSAWTAIFFLARAAVKPAPAKISIVERGWPCFLRGMRIAIIGGGPAGLRAAEIAARGGAEVTLFERKASVGRKFLVAGRGGLNLTHTEPRDRFAARYLGADQRKGLWDSLIADFDADALRAWAGDLGVETFAASTGRVFPIGLKAAPLLRRWVLRLRKMGVGFALRQGWAGLVPGVPLRLDFGGNGETQTHAAEAVILALGGASWPQTGSDGEWVKVLARMGVSVATLQPANCGWERPWSAAVLARADGQPLKNLVVCAGGREVAGELLVTKYGLEGGAIYQLGPALRTMAEPELSIDFKPGFSVSQLVEKMRGARGVDFAGDALARVGDSAPPRWQSFAIHRTFPFPPKRWRRG